MSELLHPPSPVRTLADLVAELGQVPLQRIRLQPLPGTATEADVVAAWNTFDRRLCELVDGVLVEKALSFWESVIVSRVAHRLVGFTEQTDSGVVLSASAFFRLGPGLVRSADLCYFAWSCFPEGQPPAVDIVDCAPSLTVDVLRPANTVEEMQRKRREYFQAGVKLVWQIQPRTETAEVYASPTECRFIAADQSLDGGDVLPGFSLPLKQLFQRRPRAEEQA